MRYADHRMKDRRLARYDNATMTVRADIKCSTIWFCSPLMAAEA